MHHIHCKNSTRKNIAPFVGDTHISRGQWRLEKVDEVIAGRDDSIRGAELTFISKIGFRATYYRPVQKIIPFEINEITKDKIRERCSADRELQVTEK